MTHAQADLNFECSSNDMQAVTQYADSAQGSGEVSSKGLKIFDYHQSAAALDNLNKFNNFECFV